MKEKSKNPVPENLRPYCFKPGVSGNPSGRRAKPKPLRLTEAYQRELARVDPDTGESYAQGIASQMIAFALCGDIRALLTVFSNDSEKQIKRVIDELVELEGCTRKQAALALSLFAPEVSSL